MARRIGGFRPGQQRRAKHGPNRVALLANGGLRFITR